MIILSVLSQKPNNTGSVSLSSSISNSSSNFPKDCLLHLHAPSNLCHHFSPHLPFTFYPPIALAHCVFCTSFSDMLSSVPAEGTMWYLTWVPCTAWSFLLSNLCQQESINHYNVECAYPLRDVTLVFGTFLLCASLLWSFFYPWFAVLPSKHLCYSHRQWLCMLCQIEYFCQAMSCSHSALSTCQIYDFQQPIWRTCQWNGGTTQCNSR
jgi:hypothetical protein